MKTTTKIVMSITIVIVIILYTNWNLESIKPEVTQVKALLPIQKNIAVSQTERHTFPPTVTMNVDATATAHHKKKKEEEPKPPIKMTKEGLMVLDLSRLSQKPKEELTQMQQDVDLVNQYIKDGLLSIDENLNTIFDKRDNTTYTTLEERNHPDRNTDMPLAETATNNQDSPMHKYGQYKGEELDLSIP